MDNACAPETRMIAIPPVPSGVEMAAMVSSIITVQNNIATAKKS
jgi:hypothetical protein